MCQRRCEEETKRGQESQQQIIFGLESKISQLEEDIKSLEETSLQKNNEFSQLQRLVQEQSDLVDIVAQQEITDLKTAIDDSNSQRLAVLAELDHLQQDHSKLLLKLQSTEENLETVRFGSH